MQSLQKFTNSPDVVQRIIFVVDGLILKCSVFDCLRQKILFERAGLMAAIYQGDRKENKQYRHSRVLRIRTLLETLVCTYVRRLVPVCNVAMVEQSRLRLAR